MATMEAHMGSLPQPYPSLPASPTLTNPDMILPDYDLASSPGLDDEVRSQSPLMMWKNAHAAASGADLQQLFSVGQSHHQFPTGPITPTTPIIYGNGTMLSDIGEVTEAESTPGKPSPGSIRRRTAGSAGEINGTFGSSARSRSPSPTPLLHNIRHPFLHSLHAHGRDNVEDAIRRSSPTMGVEDGLASAAGGKQRARHQQQQHASQDRARRESLESNSTITTQDQAGLFADFDDTISVGDSVFQGDDEESVAESYVQQGYVQHEVTITSSVAPISLLAVPEFIGGGGSSSGGYTSDEGEPRRLSAATLSLRAEKILANAKKRLTTMEGNLNRARNSLYISSPSGLSLPSDGSTPSPRTPIRAATASSRYHDPSPNSPMHTRIVSDGSMPTNGISTANFLQRSASALGAAGGYRPPQAAESMSTTRIDEIQDSLSGGYHRAGLSKPADIVLERLDEAEVSEDNDIMPTAARINGQADSFLSPSATVFSTEKGLTRSASVAQMRDLKDQMKDLKGKISTLREQARVDSLKRRSLQSLRTPSPFTHAQVDQWYAEPRNLQGPQSSGNSSAGRNPWNGEMSSVDEEQLEREVVERKQLEADRDVVTPTSRINGSATGSTPLSGSTNSQSTEVHRSRQATPTAAVANQLDEAAIIDVYNKYPDTPRQLAESPVLGEAKLNSPGELTPAEDDIDDMHTENGDFSDEDDSQQLEDVFVDPSESGDMDEGRDGDEEIPRSLQGEQFGPDDAEYESESGDSLYHDTFQHPVSHEDREDAFDYEHFILHSALGTIRQQRLSSHARSGSFSSEDSVETTRGPILISNDDIQATPTRRTSMSSIVTVESVDSFATANEGRESRTNLVISDSDEIVPDRTSRPAAAKDRPESVILYRQAAAAAAAANQAASYSSSDSIAAPSGKRNSAEEPRQTQQPQMIRRPASSTAVGGHHRPSVSSFESFGTTRSFPLVNRNRIGSMSAITGMGGAATTAGFRGAGAGSSGSNGSGSNHSLKSSLSAPDNSTVANDKDADLRSISETLMNETASVYEQAVAAGDERPGTAVTASGTAPSHAQALQALCKEDQMLVERLVGNLGRCVLGLSENSRASAESRALRRRIDAARRILEGLEAV